MSVFVELYRKNRQLREQSELLRTQFTAATSEELAAELQRRVAAVEEQLGALAPFAAQDEEAAKVVATLEQRVEELRSAVDTLRPGAS